MRVRLWIKHRINFHDKGTSKGDIIEILPVDADPGKLIYRSFYPVDMDLNVPCGANFKAPYKCNGCKDIDTCEMQKYKAAHINASLKVERARRYKVELDDMIPAQLKTIAYKEDNTEAEKLLIKQQADSVIFNKIQIKDKTTIQPSK